LDRPIKQTNEATQDAEEDCRQRVALRGLILLCNRACLAKKLDNSYHQTSKADTAEAVSH
jgi:hypothetical protein